MTLTKKLTKIGNSWGLILPTEVLKIVGIEPASDCDIEVDQNGIILRPHRKADPVDAKVASAMVRFIKKYRTDLKKLAS